MGDSSQKGTGAITVLQELFLQHRKSQKFFREAKELLEITTDKTILWIISDLIERAVEDPGVVCDQSLFNDALEEIAFELDKTLGKSGQEKLIEAVGLIANIFVE